MTKKEAIQEAIELLEELARGGNDRAEACIKELSRKRTKPKPKVKTSKVNSWPLR